MMYLLLPWMYSFIFFKIFAAKHVHKYHVVVKNWQAVENYDYFGKSQETIHNGKRKVFHGKLNRRKKFKKKRY